MKSMWFGSRVLLYSMIISTLFIANTAAAQQTPVNIDAYFAPVQFQFDGKHLAPPSGQKGFIYKGSTYVPLRFIAYSLDKAVDWDGATYTVTVRDPDQTELASIQEYKTNREQPKVQPAKVDASKLVPSSIPVYFETVRYVFAGESKQPAEDLPGLIYEDSLYVPMRFVSESVGKKIDWDPETYTIQASAHTDDVPAELPVEQPAPEPAPAPIDVPSGGVSSGGASAQPTAEGLTSKAESKLTALKNEAKQTFTRLKEQYEEAETLAERVTLLAKGWEEVEEIDGKVNDILQDLEKDLADNGFDTAIVQTLRDQYEALKDAELAKLGL